MEKGGQAPSQGALQWARHLSRLGASPPFPLPETDFAVLLRRNCPIGSPQFTQAVTLSITRRCTFANIGNIHTINQICGNPQDDRGVSSDGLGTNSPRTLLSRICERLPDIQFLRLGCCYVVAFCRRLRCPQTPAQPPAVGGVNREYAIKAAYLYNFGRYVTWPDKMFPNDQSPVVIGVLGPDPFGLALGSYCRA